MFCVYSETPWPGEAVGISGRACSYHQADVPCAAIPALPHQLQLLGWELNSNPLGGTGTPIPWAGTPSTPPGCSKPHPTQTWTLPGMGIHNSALAQHRCERGQNENCKSQLSHFKSSLWCFVSGSKESTVSRVWGVIQRVVHGNWSILRVFS